MHVNKMALGASFHRNVFLLNQLISPSDDFTKVFREGMFDKPNIAGFIHVSHYLLTIYDAEHFKKLVEWPVLCKGTETKYRNDVKDYLNIIASENPDIGIPNVLSTHLHHTSGTKFTTIMWKLSQLAMKKYIIRNGEHQIISAPIQGNAKDLAIIYMQQCQASVACDISSRHRNYTQMEKIANTTLTEEREHLSKIKQELFDKKQSVTKCATVADVADITKQRLINIEDIEIIQSWRDSIDQKIRYMRKKHAVLKDVEKTCEKINGIISNLLNDAKALDGKQLEKINSTPILELPFTSDIQHCLCHLYKDNKLVCHNFISLLTLMLHEVHHCLKKNSLTDLSQCRLQVEASTEDLKSVHNVFKTFLMDLKTPIAKTHNTFCERNAEYVSGENVLSFVKSVLLTSSPLIKINIDCADEKNSLQKLLQFTPKEIAHKSLFSRYERQNRDRTPNLKTSFVSRINIDNIISIDSNEKPKLNTHFLTPKMNTCRKKAGKYCRLFSTIVNKNIKANATMPLPSTARANSSTIASAIEGMPILPDLTLNITAKSLFSLSEESLTVTCSPLPCTPIKQSTSRKRARDKTEIKINKPELDEFTELRFANDAENKDLVKHEETSKRRSISDLVERYKKLLKDSNSVTTELQSKCVEGEIE